MEITFTLNIVDSCSSVVITTIAISPITYDVIETTPLDMSLAWTKSIAVCPDIVYSLSDGANSPIIQSFITLGANKLTITPLVTVADVNTYNFKVHGVIGTNPVYTNNEVSF